MPTDPTAPQTILITFLIGEGGPIPGALSVFQGDMIPQTRVSHPDFLTSNSSYSLLLWFNHSAQQADAHAEFTFTSSGANAPSPVTRIIVPIPMGVHKVILQQLVAPNVTETATLTIQAIVSGIPDSFTTSPQHIPIQPAPDANSPGS